MRNDAGNVMPVWKYWICLLVHCPHQRASRCTQLVGGPTRDDLRKKYCRSGELAIANHRTNDEVNHRASRRRALPSISGFGPLLTRRNEISSRQQCAETVKTHRVSSLYTKHGLDRLYQEIEEMGNLASKEMRARS